MSAFESMTREEAIAAALAMDAEARIASFCSNGREDRRNYCVARNWQEAARWLDFHENYMWTGTGMIQKVSEMVEQEEKRAYWIVAEFDEEGIFRQWPNHYDKLLFAQRHIETRNPEAPWDYEHTMDNQWQAVSEGYGNVEFYITEVTPHE